MVEVKITLTAEQMAQYKDEAEIVNMVKNYANHQIESQYNEEFNKLSLSDKKKKVTLTVVEDISLKEV